MSNLTETGTEAFDYFVSMVDDPAARCKIETMLLDIERESFELGLEVSGNDSGYEGYKAGYEAGQEVGQEIGYTEGWNEGYDEGREEIGGS